MESVVHDGLTYYKIKKSKITHCIITNNGSLDSGLTKRFKIDTYSFPDGRVLYDFSSHAYLFNSLADLDKYNKICSKASENEIQPICYNKKFIESIDSLVTQFQDSFKLKLNFENLEDLKVLDAALSLPTGQQLLGQVWEQNIVALIGCFILKRVKNTTWTLLKIDNSRTIAVIYDGKLAIYDVYSIYLSEFQKIKNQRLHQWNLFDSVNYELQKNN